VTRAPGTAALLGLLACAPKPEDTELAAPGADTGLSDKGAPDPGQGCIETDVATVGDCGAGGVFWQPFPGLLNERVSF